MLCINKFPLCLCLVQEAPIQLMSLSPEAIPSLVQKFRVTLLENPLQNSWDWPNTVQTQYTRKSWNTIGLSAKPIAQALTLLNKVHAGLASDQTWSLARPACTSFPRLTRTYRVFAMRSMSRNGNVGFKCSCERSLFMLTLLHFYTFLWRWTIGSILILTVPPWSNWKPLSTSHLRTRRYSQSRRYCWTKLTYSATFPRRRLSIPAQMLISDRPLSYRHYYLHHR